MRILLFIFISLSWTMSHACNCSPPKNLKEAQKKEFQTANNVLIAQITNIDSTQRIITLEVKEVFKGELIIGTEIKFKNNYFCEPFIDTLGDWIIYSKIEDGKFTINQCGLSRSLLHPERNRYFANIPPPPAPLSNDNFKSEQPKRRKNKIIDNKRLDAIRETEIELKVLRRKK